MENFQNDCCRPWTKKPFQELVFKAVKNRKRSGYVPVKWKLKHPPRAYPGHLTSFPAREGGNLINLVYPGVGHLITTHRGWGI